MKTQTPLVEEFLADHKQMSRLLYEALAAIKQGNISLARELAVRLNYVSGPHIQYEEMELYPRLKDHYGAVSEEGLIQEHHEIAAGIRSLVQDPVDDPSDLDEAERRLQIGLNHAEHCGSLVSVLAGLTDEEQAASLVVLRELRNQQRSWLDYDQEQDAKRN